MSRRQGKELLFDYEIRERVDAVMADWNDREKYPEFSDFLNALMLANDNMATIFLRDELRRLVEGKYNLDKLRLGMIQPSYQFIEDVLRTNLLHLDPERIKPANGDQPAGDQRVALFTKAALIEVTPQSIAIFNREVLAGVERSLRAGNKPHLGDILYKLFDFHMQGGRSNLAELQEKLAGTSEEFKKGRALYKILHKETVAAKPEREILYTFLQLTPAQARLLEDGLEQNKIAVNLRPARPTDFSRTLDSILKELKAKKITTVIIEELSRDTLTHQPALIYSVLSNWRNGKDGPSLVNFRALIRVLEKLAHDPAILESSKIDDLITRSGFTREQLNFSARQVVQACDEGTADIHSLLVDIRSAKDVSCALETVEAATGIPVGTLAGWENNKRSFTSDEKIRVLMEAYNHIISRQGGVPLTVDDIEKVVRVNARCRTGWVEQGDKDKALGKRPQNWRTIISAEFERKEPGPAKF